MKIDDIKIFFDAYRTDDSLISFILNNIYNRKIVDDSIKEDDFEIKLFLIKKKEEQLFWSENINSFIHLYTFSLLTEWSNDFGSIANERKEDFISHYEDDIRHEIGVFREKIDFIPQNIVNNIGFIAEEYLWDNYNEIPTLLKTFVFSGPFVEKYQKMLLKNIKTNFQNNLDCYLKFCLLLDTNASFVRTNLLELLKLTGDNDSNNLEKILESYPYYGDDFGLTLLKFCEDNSSFYKLSQSTLSKYKNKLHIDSWTKIIKNELEEKKYPYSTELCEKTDAYREIIKYLDSRHPIFFDKWNEMMNQVIDDFKKEYPSPNKLTEIKIKNVIQDKTIELCKIEKTVIYNNLKSILPNVITDAIQLFLENTKDVYENNGHKIPMTDNVKKSIYKYLFDYYFVNKHIPEYSIETDVIFDKFAGIVAKAWFLHWVWGSIEYMTSLVENEAKKIKNEFDNVVWFHIRNYVIDWCRNYYNTGINSSYLESYLINLDSTDYTFGDSDLPWYNP